MLYNLTTEWMPNILNAWSGSGVKNYCHFCDEPRDASRCDLETVTTCERGGYLFTQFLLQLPGDWLVLFT
ncbi:unnamed protein product [Boreogadus saida]